MFNLFKKKRILTPLSEVSRIVDSSTGEPQPKGYPPYAYEFNEPHIRDHILAVAVVMEDLQREGVTNQKCNIYPSYPDAPNVFGALDGQAIHVFVRTARYPNQPVLESNIAASAKIMARERNAIAYFAGVGLWPADDKDGCFFVNYRGCQLI